MQSSIFSLPSHARSEKGGFQCFATNRYKNLIAVAEYSLYPAVYLYSFPSKKLIKTLTSKLSSYCLLPLDISQLEICQMELFFSGQRLLVVSRVPSYEIFIWDIENNLRLQGVHSSIPLN